MALISAIFGGTIGFVTFLIALFLVGMSLATAMTVYLGVATLTMVSLNILAMAASSFHSYHGAADQFS